MKTEQLIQALAVDARTLPVSLGRTMGLWLVPGIAVGIAIYFGALGMRPHLFNLMEDDPRILFKIGLMVLLAILTVPLTLRLLRPGAGLRSAAITLLIVPLLLLSAITLEFYLVPEADWAPRLIGHNATFCLRCIPLLGFAPLCALLYALRDGAPSRPALAGAAAGLLSGAIGAALYATHCPDDSPFFVAAWYSLAIAILTAAGALAGARLLRW